MSFSVLVVLFCVFASGYSAGNTDETFLLNLVWKCSKSEDLGNCLKAKAAKVLDDLVQMNEPLVITDYLSLPKDPKYSGMNLRGMNESEGDLGRNTDGQGEFLDKMIWNKLGMLFTTRTIQVSLPSGVFEGRGKDKIFKKGHGFLLMAAMMGGMMMKMALGKIALIAGKALILGKIALVLSLIIALRRLSIRGGGGPPEVVFTSAEQVGGRKFRGDSQWSDQGIEMAYYAHKPETLNKLSQNTVTVIQKWRLIQMPKTVSPPVAKP